MDDFEERLQRALARVEAPPGFAERVCNLCSTELPPAHGGLLMWPRRHVRLSGALAAGILFGALAGGGFWHGQRVAEQRMEAQAQFETAMRVTNRALDETREQLNRAGMRLSD